MRLTMEQKEQYGNEIEKMDLTVSDECRKQFDKILCSYLDKVDLDNELTIKEAVMLLSDRDIRNLMDELLELYYDDEEEGI